MFHKLYSKIDITKLIILFSLLISIFISKYNLVNYDKFFLDHNGNKQNHIMIKYDLDIYLRLK